MPLADVSVYSRILQQNQQKNSQLEMKNENEQQKNKLQILKLENDKIKAQADAQKAQAETKDIQTKTLSTELDNKEKKQSLIDKIEKGSGFTIGAGITGAKKLWDVLNPAGKGERDRATKKAKDIIKSRKTAEPYEVQAQIEALKAQEAEEAKKTAGGIVPPAQAQTQAQPFSGSDKPLPAPIQIGRQGPIDIPPVPEKDTAGAIEALENVNKAVLAGIDQRQRLDRAQNIIVNNFRQAKQSYMQNMQKNMALQRELTANPPSYRKAMSNIGFFPSVIGIIDAGIQGYLMNKNPTQLIDELVAKELADQQNKYKAQQDFLKSQQTMYKQFYDLSKDEFEAESSVRAVLYKGISDRIDSYSKVATNQQQIMHLQTLNQEVKRKGAMEDAVLKDKLQKNAQDKQMKQMELDFKREELAYKKEKLRMGGGLGMKPLEVVDRRVDFGGRTYLDIPKGQLDKKEGVREVVTASRDSVGGAYRLENVAKNIKWQDLGKSLTALFSETGKASKRNFDTLNKGLIQLMLKARIDFTGGGNMSEQEQRYMRQFFEVKDGKWVLKDAQARLKIFLSYKKGEYKTLFNIVRKNAFFNALTRMKQSPTFSGLSREAQYKEVAKDLGIKSKELNDYLKGGSLA